MRCRLKLVAVQACTTLAIGMVHWWWTQVMKSSWFEIEMGIGGKTIAPQDYLAI